MNTIKKIFTAGFLLTFAFVVKGQQDPNYAHFVQFINAYNPGAVGTKDGLCINGVFRSQYTSLQDMSPQYNTPAASFDESVGPKTQGINIAMPVTIKRRSQFGVGLNIVTDRVGAENTLNLKGQFAFRKKYKSGTVFGLGFDVGVLQRTLDGTRLIPLEPGDPNVPTTQVTSSSALDLGLGAYYMNPKLNNLFVGLSATHLPGGNIEYQVQGGALINSEVVRHYYLVTGMEFVISPTFYLYPAMQFRTDATKNQVDLQTMALLQDKYRFGLNYRTGPSFADALGIMLGYQAMPNLYIGYTYDITVFNSILGGLNNGSHEFFVTYCTRINFKTSDKKYYTPRFMGGYNQF